MHYLKLCLILFALPLLANDSPTTPHSHLEAPSSQNVEHSHEDVDHHIEPEKTSNDPTTPPDLNRATESYEMAFVKTMIVLVCLIVLIVLTIWMFRRISHGRLSNFNSFKAVKVLEKRPLSPKSMLYLIEVSGKQVLIAESQLEIKALTTLELLETDKDL